MDLLKTEDVATVTLFSIRLSESELQIIADSLNYILITLNDEDLQNVFTDEHDRTFETPLITRRFVQDRYEELMELIKNYGNEKYLPVRFKEWKKSIQ